MLETELECALNESSVQYSQENAVVEDDTETGQYILHDYQHSTISDRLDSLENATGTIIRKIDFLTNKTTPNFNPEINHRLDRLEHITSTIAAKLDILLDKSITPVNQRRKTINIGFEIISSEEEIKTFEANLNEISYFNEISSWLEDNIFEITPDNRMIEILDLLFTKQFLTEFSWTGISKGKQKIAMMTFKNILELFRFHGSTNDTTITQKDVARFLMKKLKNAAKRALIKGLRKSTQHKH
ncbi:uncharacterized protein LOC128306698 [Anopheles moucheti]|uniref:uncharacterized protein LOC128306698 n=1 Tax=Anopheles moucheti TaxID=186751 RepID=UPI0022F05E30|nr:uncharacterized protein LOC128306698 [Anopheles moucheti]